MKRKYRLKSAEKAVLHGFHNGDFSGADQIAEHNKNILADVFKRVQFGLVDYAYINTGGAAGIIWSLCAFLVGIVSRLGRAMRPAMQ